MKERIFQQQVADLARLCGWMVYHTHDSRRSEPGFPDLVLVHPGRGLVVFRELKTDIGRVSPAQQEWIASLRFAGADAGVWRPAEWDDIVDFLSREQEDE